MAQDISSVMVDERRAETEAEKLDATAMAEHRLYSVEIYWRDRYFWFKEHGYLLRPRYHPEWIASWKGSVKSRLHFEDAQVGTMFTVVMSATRLSDGAQVMLKRLKKSTANELDIGQLFSNPPHNSHPSNHCVPLYDVLVNPDEDMVFLVSPLLTDWDEPELETVGEAVEFLRQLFEGLEYMHIQNVAHNDVKFDNVMLDPLPLYDEPFHPTNPAMSQDYTHPVKRHSRTLRPVKYYYIDFGNAMYFNPENGPPRIPIRPGGYGGDRSVPEFKTMTECNPFPVDVYRAGNLIRHAFMGHGDVGFGAKYGLDFMKPLLQDMCQDDPLKRPTMSEVVARFSVLLKSLSTWRLRSRLVSKDESAFSRLTHFPVHWAHQILEFRRRTPLTLRIDAH
ncbi:kinase-like domain-containing protein [Collybia nuda]|uniref:Kinase-like domain-containing protein n=1 Tax=Collybia nuda TaxID=64659 RepID=A0A9P5XTP8_9AGAR|nr:kinase-like domain-containing protein [Collybia nuda]